MAGPARDTSRGDWTAWMRRCVLSGLAVLLPAVLTLYILWLLFRIVGAFVAGPVDVVAGSLFGWRLGTVPTALIGVASTIGALLAAGAIAQRLGPAVFHRMEAAAFRRLPVARGIHAALRQLFDLFLADGAAHRGVGLVEYPRPGMYALCFITSREAWRASDDRGTRLLSVYLPTTPNPTSGYLLLVPEEDVVRLDLTVDEAARIVISGGSVPMAEGRLRLPARPGRFASAAGSFPPVGNADDAAP
jgi:uncharacterized membrane protein